MPESVTSAGPVRVGGGGPAASAGIAFQASVGALIGSWVLADRRLDSRLRLGSARAAWVRFETEAPVDDILVQTSDEGFLAIQAKTTVTLSSDLAGPLGKTVQQFVRHWIACQTGDGLRGWDRPLDPMRDRLVLAISSDASKSVRVDLSEALRLRGDPFGGELTQAQRTAWDAFALLVEQAWRETTTDPVEPVLLDELARLVSIFVVQDHVSALGALRDVLEADQDAATAFAVLERTCLDLMTLRSGGDANDLRQLLLARGVQFTSPPRYRRDIQMLRDHSDEVARSLRRYEVIEAVDGERVTLERECQAAISAAAAEGSLLVVGEPGSGKSAVINALARDLRAGGHDVVELAVDRFSVETLEGLSRELRLEHSLLEVLEAWDGHGPGWLVIDALDATRGGGGEGVFRHIIERLQEKGGRWRVVASIRTFDLKMGQRMRQLFRGPPPSKDLREPEFSSVRHVRVPPWSETELRQLLDRTPTLAAALADASPRLMDLAVVPFNTRLIADLLRDGSVRSDLHEVASQAELLRLYWERRVEGHGLAASFTLQRVVQRMVELRALRAPVEVVAQDPTTAELLVRNGVIAQVDGERAVQFRHHILFDYAVSRLLLDPTRLAAGSDPLVMRGGAGLMIAPALGFLLGEIWDRDPGRTWFWDVVVGILSSGDNDAVVRSVVARAASELPQDALDTEALARLLPHEPAAEAFRHVAGALAVGINDCERASVAPWTGLLAGIAADLGAVAGTVRFLLHHLMDRGLSADQRGELGVASRALLIHALSLDQPGSLAISGIELVAQTYDTDPPRSRTLLGAIFEPTRLAAHGWEEVPALCRRIAEVARVDPEFTEEIYRRTFGHEVVEERETRLGGGQIMSLTSNSRQDYDLARYALIEFVDKFLTDAPIEAAHALVDAVDGWAAGAHPVPPDLGDYRLSVGGMTVRVREDWSHIWAHDPESAYGHDGAALVKQFVEHLTNCNQDAAMVLIGLVIKRASLALFWARMFMVAARRNDAAVDLLLPFAMEEPLVLMSDTSKDAVDLIAVGYQRLPPDQRAAFERRMLQSDFSGYAKPDLARRITLGRLFRSIGQDLLATLGARELAAALADEDAEEENERRFVVRTSFGNPEPYYWIQGLDRGSEPNSKTMAAIEVAKSALSAEPGSSIGPFPPLDEAFTLIEETLRTAGTTGVDARLAGYAEGIVGIALAHMVAARLLNPHNATEMARFVAAVEVVARSRSPELRDDTEADFERGASWGSPAARLEVAGGMLDVLPQVPTLYERFAPLVDDLLADPHPAVRLHAGLHLVRLWDIDRQGFWRRVQDRLTSETNQGVLDHLINKVLGRLLHEEPAITENLALALLGRFQDSPDRQARMRAALSDELTVLWITHAQRGALEVLRMWIDDAVRYTDELVKALGTMRGAFVLGLADGNGQDANVRARAFELTELIVDAACSRLAAHLELSQPDAVDIAAASAAARLLDGACRELYFATGPRARAEGQNVIGGEGLATFFAEAEPLLRRIGEYGTPHTIYYLLQLVESLVPVDAVAAFDLTVHALTEGGRRFQYQLEPLGADLVVRLVGIFLADHKELFSSERRRGELAECLEIFMDAGWPAARRLLYLLPELVQ